MPLVDDNFTSGDAPPYRSSANLTLFLADVNCHQHKKRINAMCEKIKQDPT